MRNPKILIVIAYDAMWTLLAIYLSLAMRFGVLDIRVLPIPHMKELFLVAFIAQISCLTVSGLYQGIWRFSSTNDLIRIFKGATFGVVLTMVLSFGLNRLEMVPRSLFIIDWLVLVMGLGGARFLFRMWKDSQLSQNSEVLEKKKVLIIGAGSAGERLLRDIQLNPQMGLQVAGFVDDDQGKLNRTIHGVRILGMTAAIPRLVKSLQVKSVFIAIPSASGEQMDSILKLCADLDVEIKTLPRVDDILAGKIEVSLLRNLSLDDLLGRKAVELDSDHISSMIHNRTVMVTGAGGSIGSELCRQIGRYNPTRLVLFESCEYFLYEIELELKRVFASMEIVPIIGDVRDFRRVDEVMQTYRPELVFHAAAYKHVPMMEKNPSEAIRTNVLGTKNVAEAAENASVKKFVLISSDKAVNPTNVMGTTKRIAEMLLEDLATRGGVTKFMIVRFGNVIGSNGSVIPLFKRQIETGGPITITHPEITRYFMSISEASKLVLQAASMGIGGEVFVLDMGKPIKIVDLVDRLLQLAGLEKGKDIQVEFIGLRPGEKLFEELFQSGEDFAQTSHAKIFRAKNRPVDPLFSQRLDEIVMQAMGGRGADLLVHLVPEYTKFN